MNLWEGVVAEKAPIVRGEELEEGTKEDFSIGKQEAFFEERNAHKIEKGSRGLENYGSRKS